MLDRTTPIDQIILNYPLQNVRFFYVNVLIPVGAGACAALLIAFLVVLCRCCRRRKLKKVRYFGKVPVVASNIIIILFHLMSVTALRPGHPLHILN